MSRSPTDGSSRESEHGYRRSWQQLNEFIADGRSLSGHERKCCFLNVGSGRFANVAAVTAFDWDDDGRAIATVDWDHDGDLDAWMENRTGPRLRYLRNDVASGHHFLALELAGRACNRDSIGARVEVTVAGEAESKLVKSLRAGEGFLAQSSKWVHFGLGDSSVVERVRVRWPDGIIDDFTNLDVDRFYRLSESGPARPWPPKPRGHELQPSPQPHRQRGASRAFLASRVPLPALTFETFDGSRTDITVRQFKTDKNVHPTLGTESAGPVLLNFWASWCQPCLAELTEFGRYQSQLRSAGVNIIALSADKVIGESDVGPKAARELLEKLGFPFDAGRATASLVEKLELVHAQLFDEPRTMQVPTSFLIDSDGALAAIYRGPVKVEQLVDDVRALTSEGKSNRDPANTIDGRWVTPPKRIPLENIAWELLEHGYIEDGVEYSERHQEKMTSKDFAKLMAHAGSLLKRRGQYRDAVERYRQALNADGEEPVALNNLAWLHATAADAALRNGAEAVRLAKKAVQARVPDPSVLDTLAAAYAEAGMFDEAATTARQAIELARSTGQMEAAESISNHLAAFTARRPLREKR